ncbi:hypothetical protein LTR36_003939 [Oleoguttula mirabilis]|uniref:F-box domain-containing protein n=1 Tax=Oleoguttula mirabilis TaxID=1507867 RepID=A0AAV9JI41_9PEZI|nr:hypothetical protein LTR36_003939 [Oleoguttula mirabilis]
MPPITAARQTLTCSQPGGVLIRHVTPSQRELDATSCVFNTAELLEKILVGLPATELLFRAQLVCKHFRTAIQDTLSLQHIMFLASDADAESHKTSASEPHEMPPCHIRYLANTAWPEDPPPGWFFLGVVQPDEARLISEFAGVREIYVAQPMATSLLLTEACPNTYSAYDWDVQREHRPVIKVHSGVKFKHVFASIQVFCGGWNCGNYSQGGDDSCEEHLDGNHAMQVDVGSARTLIPCWSVLHKWKVFEAKGLESDVEAWTTALKQQHSEWRSQPSS